jgi:16S rRNA (cytosine1402-N4)-methyltransferase
MTSLPEANDSAEQSARHPLPASGHDPVLLTEVLDLLSVTPGKTIIDGTTGRGGHSLAIAEKLGPTGQLICLDADPRNLEFARTRLAAAPCAVRFFHANFAELDEVLKAARIEKIDGLLADLGISTNQLFESDYGMSFSVDMPLDMRVDPRLEKTAGDLVNHLREEDLANVLYELAQERCSRRIARKIGEARRLSPIITTGRLAELVRLAIPRRGGAPEKIDPATRTFLALRMAVNQELENLAELLKTAPKFLQPGGRLVVISFQSMEDRLVKQAFRSLEATGTCKVLTPRPISPEAEELARNPRSRSSKLRAVMKAL